MKLLLSLLSVLGVIASLASAQANDTPDLNIQTTFPNNAFNRVSNGQANRVVFSVTPPRSEDRILTLEGIKGAFLNRDKIGKRGYVMRNMTETKYKSLPIKPVDGKPLQVPYDFYPEFKPQELGVEFRLIVNDQQTGKKHNLHAYTGTVTVVEPAKSWFDLQALSLYAILAGIVGTAIWWASQNYPGSKTISKRKERSAAASSSAASPPSPSKASASGVKVPGQAGYDEDWIPEHHLKKGSRPTSPRPRSTRSGSSKK